jgi:hypothetical protein
MSSMIIAIKIPEAVTVGVGLWGGDSVGVGDAEALGDSEEEGEGDPDSEDDSNGEEEGDEFKAVVVGVKEGLGELVGEGPW